jgi:hypothetical protein
MTHWGDFSHHPLPVIEQVEKQESRGIKEPLDAYADPAF